MGQGEVEGDRTIPIAIGIGIAFIFALILFRSCDDCDKKGGVLVQGAVGYECVEKK